MYLACLGRYFLLRIFALIQLTTVVVERCYSTYVITKPANLYNFLNELLFKTLSYRALGKEERSQLLCHPGSGLQHIEKLVVLMMDRF